MALLVPYVKRMAKSLDEGCSQTELTNPTGAVSLMTLVMSSNAVLASTYIITTRKEKKKKKALDRQLWPELKPGPAIPGLGGEWGFQH